MRYFPKSYNVPYPLSCTALHSIISPFQMQSSYRHPSPSLTPFHYSITHEFKIILLPHLLLFLSSLNPFTCILYADIKTLEPGIKLSTNPRL